MDIRARALRRARFPRSRPPSESASPTAPTCAAPPLPCPLSTIMSGERAAEWASSSPLCSLWGRSSRRSRSPSPEVYLGTSSGRGARSTRRARCCGRWFSVHWLLAALLALAPSRRPPLCLAHGLAASGSTALSSTSSARSRRRSILPAQRSPRGPARRSPAPSRGPRGRASPAPRPTSRRARRARSAPCSAASRR